MRINGEEVYSKLATGEFPEPEAIAEEVGRRLQANDDRVLTQADVPSHFQEGPVGQDRSDVYTPGDPPPPTPGFGRSAGAQGDKSQSG